MYPVAKTFQKIQISVLFANKVVILGLAIFLNSLSAPNLSLILHSTKMSDKDQFALILLLYFTSLLPSVFCPAVSRLITFSRYLQLLIEFDPPLPQTLSLTPVCIHCGSVNLRCSHH